jgi:ATP-dependent helicase HrpA
VHGLIGHTQPRRIAARTGRGAHRAGAEESSSAPSATRCASTTSVARAYVKLMTDGILLAETQGDPLTRQYDTLIIDEAHERSLNIDFLLGYLRAAAARPDLKLIVTSATIDAERSRSTSAARR